MKEDKKNDEKNITLAGFLDDNGTTAKYVAKASVFTNLFSEEEYRFQLYKALHPEDKDIRRGDIGLMTLESQLVNQQFNDLGILIRDKLIILVEAQSTWSENIVVRVLLYLIESWNKYIKRMELDIYATKKITLPRPELYVIYTKEDADRRPDSISLDDSFFDGEKCCVDCTVRVIKKGEKGDIISQYVRFCRVFDEQIGIHGRTQKAVEETIRICQDENVLGEYLERQREEVIDIMTTLFDKETIMKNHDAAVRREAQKETQKDMVGLMNYLMSNGRNEDVLKALTDENFLNKLLTEFRSGLMAVK